MLQMYLTDEMSSGDLVRASHFYLITKAGGMKASKETDGRIDIFHGFCYM